MCGSFQLHRFGGLLQLNSYSGGGVWGDWKSRGAKGFVCTKIDTIGRQQ